MTVEQLKILHNKLLAEYQRRNRPTGDNHNLSKYAEKIGFKDYDQEYATAGAPTKPANKAIELAAQANRLLERLILINDTHGDFLVKKAGTSPASDFVKYLPGDPIPLQFNYDEINAYIDKLASYPAYGAGQPSGCNGACVGLCTDACVGTCGSNDTSKMTVKTGGMVITGEIVPTLANSGTQVVNNGRQIDVSIDEIRKIVQEVENAFSAEQDIKIANRAAARVMLTMATEDNSILLVGAGCTDDDCTSMCGQGCSGCGPCGVNCGDCTASCQGECDNSCFGECKGCTGGCTGECDRLCNGDCTGGCNGECRDGCSVCTSCTSDCASGCSVCTGCSAYCQSCTGCTGGCASGCSDCTGCTGSCNSYCSVSCTGGCNTNCKNDCNGCYSTCTNGCDNSCNNSCWGSCNTGCIQTCTGTCKFACAQSCGQGCASTCISLAS